MQYLIKTLEKLNSILVLFIIFLMISCNSVSQNEIEEGNVSGEIEKTEDDETESESEETEPDNTNYDITNILSMFTSVIDKDLSNYVVGNTNVRITTQDLPDHKSPYYQRTEWEAEWYEEITSGTFRKNPNSIGKQNTVFTIPLHPISAEYKEETPMGPIGIARNGVLIFNQYAAQRAPLDREFQSFDNYNGHPAGTTYHYHVEPLSLTEKFGEDALLGLLLDGFPFYGPLENGVILTSDDLDEYHGHFSKTAEFPDGIYHYHVTATAPYINGDGFYGVPGNVSR